MREFIERPSWHAQAVCRGVDPDIMFPGRGQLVLPIAEVCRSCPVRASCLAQAMTDHAHHGVWGGASERHRRTLRRTRRIVMAHGDVAIFDRGNGVVTITTSGPVLSTADARIALEAHALTVRPEALAAAG